MNEFFRNFIESAKALAIDRNLEWDIPCDAMGKIDRANVWNLNRLAGIKKHHVLFLGTVGYHAAGLKALNRIRSDKGLQPIDQAPMPFLWQEVYKAVLLHHILVDKIGPEGASNRSGVAMRILASCAHDVAPWEITSDLVQLAFNVCLQTGNCGSRARDLEFLIKGIFDRLHLADRCPLRPFCIPYNDKASTEGYQRFLRRKQYHNHHSSIDFIRDSLEQRKTAAKLPEDRAFWELARIVFTERPQNFLDAVRFAQTKLGILTGFRISENAMLPFDWARWHEHVDVQGRSAGERGGISRSLAIRHFAAKQKREHGDHGVVLYETLQHVPQMFEQITLDTLNDVARITAPLRKRLRQQVETGRMLPEYSRDELVAAAELYTCITGALWFLPEAPPDDLVDAYRKSHSVDTLRTLRRRHEALCKKSDAWTDAVRKGWHRFIRNGEIIVRDRCGIPYPGRVCWTEAYMRVGDVEDMIRRLQRKMPPTEPWALPSGKLLYPHELLFLVPSHPIIEGRDGGILDIERHFAVDYANPIDLIGQFGSAPWNMFIRYGRTDEDKKLHLTTHMLRHLQNNELFRLGIADTIISKRFNRRSVAQNHVYDHRTLAEDLAAVTVSDITFERLAPKARETAKLILSGRGHGPIVDEFKKIQRELGDGAAFEYLSAEADGLHVTPYGFCVNSFTVDPCPKHLECFNGCRHLTRTEVAGEQQNLETLHGRIMRSIAEIEAMPSGHRTPGWENQLKHARIRQVNIEKLLATAPGARPFPDGLDLSQPIGEQSDVASRRLRRGGK